MRSASVAGAHAEVLSQFALLIGGLAILPVDQCTSGSVVEGGRYLMPVSELVLKRTPTVVNLVFLQLRAHQLHAVIRQHRDEQVNFDSFVLTMIDGPQSQIALERAEGVFDVGQLPVGAPDVFQYLFIALRAVGPGQVIVEMREFAFESLALGFEDLIGDGLACFAKEVEAQFPVAFVQTPQPRQLPRLRPKRLIGLAVGCFRHCSALNTDIVHVLTLEPRQILPSRYACIHDDGRHRGIKLLNGVLQRARFADVAWQKVHRPREAARIQDQC